MEINRVIKEQQDLYDWSRVIGKVVRKEDPDRSCETTEAITIISI